MTQVFAAMMKCLLIVKLIGLLLIIKYSQGSDDNFNENTTRINEEFYSTYPVDFSLFAGKTSYENSFVEEEERGEGLKQLNIINNYCQPRQINYVLRHGTRNPSREDIYAVNSIIEQLITIDPLSELVRNWSEVMENFPMATAGSLVEVGREEQYNIGQRIAERFPSLFYEDKNFTTDDFSFFASSVKRCIESCEELQSGLFSQLKLSSDEKKFLVKISNNLTRFYDYCEAYQDLLLDADTYKESVQYQNTEFFNITQRFTQAIGFPELSLTKGEMRSLYRIAGTELAVLNTTNIAQFIEPNDLRSLEYATDLQSYYTLGYGNAITYEQSCPLLSRIFQNMDEVIRTSSSLKGEFFVGHTGTVLALLETLGLFNDSEPLTAENSAQQGSRLYRNSQMAPFSANLGMVLYSCDMEKISKDFDQVPEGIFPLEPAKDMLILLHNEIPMKFPSCKYLACSYEEIRSHYSRYIDDCDFDEICSNEVIAITAFGERTSA